MTDRVFEFPMDYDFEKIFNRQFGIIKDEVFEVVVELTGWVARYVAERVWSPGQQVAKKGKDRVQGAKFSRLLQAQGSCAGAVVLLGTEAQLIEPDWLVKRVSSKVYRLKEIYKA